MTMCPCTIVPTYHCAHIPLSPHIIVPMYYCVHVLLCQRTIVPTHQWKCYPETCCSAHVSLCPHTIVPNNENPICPHINVSMYHWAHLCPHTQINVKGQSDPNWVSEPYKDQRSKCPKLGHSDQCWGQTWWPTLGQVTVDHHDQVWVNKIFDSMWLIMTQFGSQWPFELNIGH